MNQNRARDTHTHTHTHTRKQHHCIPFSSYAPLPLPPLPLRETDADGEDPRGVDLAVGTLTAGDECMVSFISASAAVPRDAAGENLKAVMDGAEAGELDGGTGTLRCGSNTTAGWSAHAYIHTYIHTYIHAYMLTCIHAYIHAFINA
jgi:hypothetical protein